MSLYRKKPCFIPPLFDRMSQELPELITEEGVNDSLRREISLMLNTRTTISITQENSMGKHLWNEEGQVLFANPEIFGLMDFADIDFSDSIQVRNLENLLSQTLCVFDRRLTDVVVIVQEVDQLQNRFIFKILGNARLQARTEKISFPVEINLDMSLER